MVKVGDLWPTWFSGREDGMSTVLGVFPYIGPYTEYFDAVLLLACPHTRSGELSMTVKLPEYRDKGDAP